ncbi:hypothetical protein PFICI_04206 [Pestalotiopsis fici W106-1]|uniref:Uncharacterized protein n=1 Tax=Pestalotiopsis fici (strain W106-1 / CGMCC3.15140) TaxID=1229662 RepID=W3X8G8_PESFW|nr:uncharacterized protein PFICI_04206 [Pestalotiopsis fici W106-1]ETS82330.1 hypothetical protein PFICI_04206 [Pestalotiopsis fici W106-1]
MPGAVRMEAPNGAAPLGGVYAGMFRPPTSPSISNSNYFGRSPGSIYSDSPTPAFNVKRKRYEPRDSTALYSDAAMDVDSASGSRPYSGSGHDTRYTFAASIETPYGAEHKQLGHMDDSTYSDVDYRRALISRRTDMPCSKPPTATSIPGWSRLALETIGGVVGKVWDFCTVGAFRGFYAGGGRGYDVNPGPVRGSIWCNEHDVPTLPDIPGGFPDADYARFQAQSHTPDSTPPPAAKRRQVSNNAANDELRRNWVMVEDPTDKPRNMGSPQSQRPTQNRPLLNRRISKPIGRLANTGSTQQSARPVSHAGNVALTNRQPASYASPRSPAVSDRPATPSRLPVPSRARSSSTATPPRMLQQPSQIPSPSPYTARGHRRTHSAASTASGTLGQIQRRQSSAHEIVEETSPRLDARARNMVAKRMIQEQETDARINDFNSRLMDMIREGREALGTTIEVDVHDDYRVGNDQWEDD